MMKFLTKLFGTQHDREMKRLTPLVEQINTFESSLKDLSTDQLTGKTNHFKERISRGETLDQILPEAFAVCREAALRVLGMRHYDVQLIGGIVLHKGSIAEMRTGEGKTLVATLPMYLNALSGKGAHLVTVNDYLAKRDCEWMGQLYNFLGLTTGTIVHSLSDSQRKAAYGADITYGTNNEFGFDYLRDNMKFDLSHYVQRELNFAIVDECDSILIDEARTPLIISGQGEGSVERYYEVNKIIPALKADQHFIMEEKSKTVSLTEEGNAKIEELMDVDNIYAPQHIELLHYVYQGLKAHHLFKRDVDYMVKDGEIVIVDEFTGRLMTGRRWSDGLHQAVEAKEGVSVKSENQTLATITFQNYFRMYNKISGMTGTADTEAVEFKKIYNLDVIVIPTHRSIQRKDQDDVVYKTENGKFKAIAQDIKERNEKGQPVLVGTVSIERSERISSHLKKAGIPHHVLNAKHHEREAEIIAQAGRKGAVTIATNMAGRGTDIVLGGNPEGLARMEVGPQGSEENFELATQKFKTKCLSEKEEVIGLGGLYIVGTERHESRRIDNQLRGRSGRQGDPGESRFYLSLEDDLMRIFNGEKIKSIMNRLNVPEDEPITAGMVSRAIEGAQKKVEGHHFDVRKNLIEYDDVMNKQRTVIYGLRRKILANEGIERIVLDMMGEVTSSLLDKFVHTEAKRQEWDLEGLHTALQKQFGVHLDVSSLKDSDESQIIEKVSHFIKAAFEDQKKKAGEHFESVQKIVLLQTIDTKWKEHLSIVDHLKEGINLRAYAQKDPLIEYKKEAFNAFEQLNSIIREETLEILFKIQVRENENPIQEFGNLEDYNEGELEYTKPDAETLANEWSREERSDSRSAISHHEEEGYSYQGRGGGSGGDLKLNRAERRKRKLDSKK